MKPLHMISAKDDFIFLKNIEGTGVTKTFKYKKVQGLQKP